MFFSKPTCDWLAVFVFVVALATFSGWSHADEIDFKGDIAPILEERCLYCHGEDEQESGLRLDVRPLMLRGGHSGLPAVVPGKPEKSYLLEVVSHLDPTVKMPPDEEKIPQREIELLTRWIKEGAVWPGQMEAVAEEASDHWAFQSVVRPEVPVGPQSSTNPIDGFPGWYNGQVRPVARLFERHRLSQSENVCLSPSPFVQLDRL